MKVSWQFVLIYDFNRYIEQQLMAASQMPTWTNIAYHKYYANGNPVPVK